LLLERFFKQPMVVLFNIRGKCAGMRAKSIEVSGHLPLAQLVSYMHEGYTWQAAAALAGVDVSQSTAYRLYKAVRERGEAALQDGRHGHPSERATELYRVLNDHQMEWEQQDMDRYLLRKTIKQEQEVADAEIEEYQQRQWKAYHTSNREFAKCEKYCREQRELLRAIDDLALQERDMYELDNCKDQIMTVCKVALANLSMWVRDHYFSEEYACPCRLASLTRVFSVARSGALGENVRGGRTQAV
jgi:transposase